MSVIYFTNNAGSGAGSFVEAIKNASPGDVVRPDESVFERGSTIEIVLSATLTLDKNLTLDGGPFRVRLNADGRTRCVALAENANVEMTAFDVVGAGWNSQTNADAGNAAGAGLYVPGGSKIALNRCGFFACRGTYGGAIAVGTGAAATLNDCVVAGCYARGSGAGLRSVGDVSVYGSTIMGNVEVSPGTSSDILVDGSGAGRVTLVNSIVGIYRGNVDIGDGCVVGVASSQIGFVAPPPDDLSAETWNANAWRNWDLRLLDDASPNPSPYRDAGDVDAASQYDFDGNFRGRETNGVAARSPGAYETIQANLFWVGIPFLAPGNLKVIGYDASTRRATLSWTANLAGTTGYNIQQSTNGGAWSSLSDSSGSSTTRLMGGIIDGSSYAWRIRAFNETTTTPWSSIRFTAGSDEATTEYVTPSPSWGAANGWANSRFASVSGDVAPQEDDVIFIDGAVSLDGCELALTRLIIGGRAEISFAATETQTLVATVFNVGDGARLTSSSGTQGFCVRDSFSVSRFGENVCVDVSFSASDNAAFEIAETARFKNFSSSSLVYKQGVFESYRLNVSDATRIDGDIENVKFLTINAQDGGMLTASVTPRVLCEQFVWERYGGVGASALTDGSTPLIVKPSVKAAVSGDVAPSDFLVDVSASSQDATIALTLTGQVVYGDARQSSVAIDGSARIDERGLTSRALALNAEASLIIDGGNVRVETLTLADASRVETSGSDAFLSASESAVVGAATVAGVGYFATASGTDLSAATIASDVRVCEYGANVETVSATVTGKNVEFKWSAANVAAPVLIERRVDDSWTVVANGVSGGSFTISAGTFGNVEFRIFDGATFHRTLAYVEPFHVWLVYDNLFTSAIVVKSYKVVTEYILMSAYFNANEAPVFLARIEDSATNVAVIPGDVDSISLTVYKQELYRGSKRKTELNGWVNVAVPVSAIKDELVVDDPRWKKDSVGYNFLYEPDLREKKLFAEAGEYVAIITVTFKEGNPAPLVFNVSVK